MNEKKNSSYFLDSKLILNKAKLEEGNKIADLGCGSSGYFAFPAARIVGRKGLVYVVDVLKEVLEVLKKRADQENLTNIKEIWSNIEVFKGVSIETESLDVAFLFNTLFQSQKKEAILRETVRILKKNGRLLIVDWENFDSPLGPPLENRVKKDYLKTIAQKNGLKLEEEFNPGDCHFGLLFTKL